MSSVLPYNSRFSGGQVDACVDATAIVVNSTSDLPSSDLETIPENRLYIVRNTGAVYHCVQNGANYSMQPLTLAANAAVTGLSGKVTGSNSSGVIRGNVNLSDGFSVNTSTNTLNSEAVRFTTDVPEDYGPQGGYLKIVMLESRPSTYYPGYLYFIKES